MAAMEECWECESAADLRALGATWAAPALSGERSLEPGSVVALTGDLGAGKTEFTKGLAQGLDYQEFVTSPTFALLQEYWGGRWPLFHLDFYRLQSADEVLDLGWDELLERGGVVVVEWPDRFPELIPPEALWIDIRHRPQGGREVRRARWENRPAR
jgi:tRNA threonylcarbamoyladenosine biosynthesis protein TsaE